MPGLLTTLTSCPGFPVRVFPYPNVNLNSRPCFRSRQSIASISSISFTHSRLLGSSNHGRNTPNCCRLSRQEILYVLKLRLPSGMCAFPCMLTVLFCFRLRFVLQAEILAPQSASTPAAFEPWPQASSRLERSRPRVLALPTVQRFAVDTAHPQARNRHRLATQNRSFAQN